MKKLFLSFFLLLFGAAIDARQPYQATVDVGLVQATVSAPNLVNLTDELSEAALVEIAPFYTPTSPLAIDINLRGIYALGDFAAGSATFEVVIPQTGVVKMFAGATRDESLVLFRDYVRNAGDFHNLLHAYSRYSPIDPIAGNPNSLMALMGEADYLLGHLSPLSGCDPCWTAQPVVRLQQGGVGYARSFSKGYDTTIVTLPLRFSYSPCLKSAFIADIPLTYLRNGGASSLVGSMGLAYRLDLFHFWSLTGVVRGGVGGSLDLCTAGSFVSGGLISVLNGKIDRFVISLNNYAGYISSTNLWLTGINFNYNLHNYIFKNGVEVTTCSLFHFPLDLKLTFTDTCFVKDRLYLNHFDEAGFYLITKCINPYFPYDLLMAGFSYQFGEQGYHAYIGKVAYQF